MDLNELGAAVEDFCERQGMPHHETLHGLIVAEEAGEVARAVLKGKQRIRGTEDYWRGELAKELAGVVAAAAGCAAHFGIDLEAEVGEELARLEVMPIGAMQQPRPAHT